MTPNIQWTGVCIDCADAEATAAFYGALFGWTVNARDGSGWIQLRSAEGGVGLNIQAEAEYVPPVWPEQPGAQAKMMHFEIAVNDLESAVALVINAGGEEAAWQPRDRDQLRIRVMLDPAGHPFCLFVHGE